MKEPKFSRGEAVFYLKSKSIELWTVENIIRGKPSGRIYYDLVCKTGQSFQLVPETDLTFSPINTSFKWQQNR